MCMCEKPPRSGDPKQLSHWLRALISGLNANAYLALYGDHFLTWDIRRGVPLE